ncbi:MAG: polysaccharide biosynthesis tyrosine autokinase [bacterium]
MYTTFYGLTGPPFNNTPDPDFFFMSSGHQRTLLFLLYAIREKKGLITVTGKAGTGKTALLQVIQKEIGQAVKMIFFLDTGSGNNALIGHLLEKLGVTGIGASRDSFGLLREGLLHQLQQGISVVLVIDEAQNLDWRQLEQIRLLLNLETADQKLLSIILAGQPELQTKLNQPAFQQLKQRVDLSCRIDPLTESESFHYVEYRLQSAGRDQQDIFSYEALLEIYYRSQGIPRLINNICDKALLLGFSRQQQLIDQDIIQDLSSLFESPEIQPDQSRLVQRSRSHLPAAGSPAEARAYWFQMPDYRYRLINSGKRMYPWRTSGAAGEEDEAQRFLRDGLRAILGQYGQEQQQERKPGEHAAGEKDFMVSPGPPRGLPPASRTARQQKAFEATRQQSTPPGQEKEGSLLQNDQPSENFRTAEPARPKPLSPEYIKRFESLNLLPSGREQGEGLKGWLLFLPRFLIQRSRRLLGLEQKIYSPPSKIIEEYQRIKNNLYLANPGSRLQALMFASSNSGEGTSSVAANFALTSALTEEARVLLVDANFRSPKLHSLFGLPKSEGLGEVIREKVGWKDVLRSCKIPNLSIITAGEPAINPLYLLKSATLEKTIQEFKEHFDYILFDCCALNAYSDPILLGAHLDGLILVVHAGRTSMESVRRVKGMLSGSVPIMGVILNRKNYYIPEALYRRL